MHAFVTNSKKSLSNVFLVNDGQFQSLISPVVSSLKNHVTNIT